MTENTQIVKNMNLVERFALILTKEPKKSFRMAGITDGNDLLTPEGARIFLTYLLNQKYADDFKKEVVDLLIKNMDKDNK